MANTGVGRTASIAELETEPEVPGIDDAAFEEAVDEALDGRAVALGEPLRCQWLKASGGRRKRFPDSPDQFA